MQALPNTRAPEEKCTGVWRPPRAICYEHPPWAIRHGCTSIPANGQCNDDDDWRPPRASRYERPPRAIPKDAVPTSDDLPCYPADGRGQRQEGKQATWHEAFAPRIGCTGD